MKQKLFLSKGSMEMFNRASEISRNYGFDALNVPVLIASLLQEESIFREYVLEGSFEDVDAFAGIIMSDRVRKLEKDYEKENDKKKEEKTKTSMNSQIAGAIDVTDYENYEVRLLVSEDFLVVFNKTMEICVDHSIFEMKPIHFVVALFALENKDLKELFKLLEINFFDAKTYFDEEAIFKLGVIPYNLSSFLSNINEKVDISKPCEILNRDEEVETLWNIMLKKNKRNAVIVGEAGVGKSALIEKIAYEICKGTCPKKFKDFKVISLDVNALVAGTMYRGQAEERTMGLISFLQERNDVILFIDEIHTILGAGACREGEMDLSNALKPILARGETIVIGATTMDEYKRYFAVDAALSRRFEKVEIDEPLSEDVYPMIKNKVKVLSEFHGVRISKKMVEHSILIASCFDFEKKNPDKTLDLIDRAMVSASRDRKKSVDKESILKNFGIYYEMFDEMSIDAKKEVAYHEAGHYIVGKFSGRLVSYNWKTISILPAEDYMGITVFETLPDKVPFENLDYYIDEVAFRLGGRVAEKLFTGDYTSGAGQDLNQATKMAFNVVTKLGMGTTDTLKNRIYLNSENYPMFSENATNLINDEVNKFIEKAYKRAEEIIFENRPLLEMIVKELLKKQIVSEPELDKICKRYRKKSLSYK